ncbi:hypothetical protein IJM86_01945 [bacterium]|nr:hypothetical protein [bacterium]
MIKRETTILIIPFAINFPFSPSQAEITLNHVMTVIIIAKKKAPALSSESTFQTREFSQYCALSDKSCRLAVCSTVNTVPNNQLAHRINTAPNAIYQRFFADSLISFPSFH